MTMTGWLDQRPTLPDRMRFDSDFLDPRTRFRID